MLYYVIFYYIIPHYFILIYHLKFTKLSYNITVVIKRHALSDIGLKYIVLYCSTLLL